MNTPLDNIIAALKLCPSIKSCDIECGNESFNGDYIILDYYYLLVRNINNSKIHLACALNPSELCIYLGSRVLNETIKGASALIEEDLKFSELQIVGENIRQHSGQWNSTFNYKYQSDLHL